MAQVDLDALALRGEQLTHIIIDRYLSGLGGELCALQHAPQTAPSAVESPVTDPEGSDHGP
jgi:hypothetical protein